MPVPWYWLGNGRKKRVSGVADTISQSQNMDAEGIPIFRLVCSGPRNEWISLPRPDSINSMCAIAQWACGHIFSLRVPVSLTLL